MATEAHPSVLIVGRTNVGKSTLFNRLSSNVKSLIFNRDGVTRDFLTDTIAWKDSLFDLVDTGGISTKKVIDPLEKAVQDKLAGLLQSASAVLFVCDGTVGISNQDRTIAKMLHKKGTRTIVVVNKIDNKKLYHEHQYDFDRLGFSSVVPISAHHGIGIDDLLESLASLLPYAKQSAVQKDDTSYRVTLLGKPNVGKSSLMNLLLKKDRTVVADKPGTTREAIHDSVRFYQQDIQLVDTAGVRKKRSVVESLEKLMVKSTLQAVRDSDMVLLLVDSSEGMLSDQELKLAYYIVQQQHKGLILLFNKHDLIKNDSYAREQLAHSLDEYPDLMKQVEWLSISCKTGHHIGKVLQTVEKVWHKLERKFCEEELTLFFKDCLQKRPLYRRQKRLEVFRAKQINTRPMTIMLSVGLPQFFTESHVKFFENCMRKAFDLKGVAIKFVLRK